jgi:hypothetical protein
MIPRAKKLLEQLESWPEEDQEELVEYAREIEARRTGEYHATAVQRPTYVKLRGDRHGSDGQMDIFSTRS